MSAVPATFEDRKVCVVGLGYVGLTLATTMAELGFAVTGVEVRPDVVEQLRRGEPHFFEPGMADRFRRTTTDGLFVLHESIPGGCEASVFVITVGTPLDDAGRTRLDMVERASGEVAAAMQAGSLVIMRSTVKLGTTRAVVRPVLEASGKPFDLAFCPERTLEGRAMEELRWLPQIVGADTNDGQLRAARLFQFVTPTVVRVADVETAEMIKMVDNASRDVAFAFANEIARVCDAVGVSASEVIQAGKLGYPRTNLPLPGPVGGPCLSKDPHILAEGLEGTGIMPEMTIAARRINERQPDEVVEFLSSTAARLGGFPPGAPISLVGLAFKGQPATDDTRGTMAIPVLAALRARFPQASFRGFDAEVTDNGITAMGLEPCATIEDAFAGAHLVVVLNNHTALMTMALEKLTTHMARPGLVYDFWNLFRPDELRLPDHVGYVGLGSHARAILPEAP
jgi:UDP-N-acetyl-D-mannosaminuronic acid dehydrogenase